MTPFAALARVRARTWIVHGAIVVVLAAAITTTLLLVLPTRSEAQEVTTTATASLETLEQSVEASGTLSPLVTEELSFAASGTVLSVDVVAGQTVEAGDELAAIDTLQATADLLQAEATLADAEAQLASASTSSAIAAAQAAVSVAEAAVDDAQDALDGTTLTAPVAGVVTAVGVEVGDVTGSASGAGGTSTSTSAFTIVGQDSWQVDVTVGEAEMALIAVDNQVELSTDDGTAFFGVVSEIGLLPSTTSGSAAYPVTITVTGTADGLYDGIAVTATIIYERRTDVLTIPSAAVSTADDGSTTVLLVQDDGTQLETVVELGETSGTLVEILSGLAEGDEVVVATFTPGEGNDGQTGVFPGGGTLPDGATLPDGGGFPGGGTEGTFPGGGTAPGATTGGQNG